MALLVPNVGEVVLLSNLLAGGSLENWTLKLYKTDVTPAEGDTAASYTEADFTGCALENARLVGARMNGAVLFCADLRGADFRGAKLHHADLRGANLKGARFDKVKQTGKNTKQGTPACAATAAGCQGANLSYANLTGATGCSTVTPSGTLTSVGCAS
jgi:uncharacterized protein YjbI with pentapeptide repeats